MVNTKVKSISGSVIVDEISKMHINSIPEAWYSTIRQKKQPHAIAILILWDLIYWYKWTELRDEITGKVTGYKKKFRADLLQRSYDDIANKFGISKRQATDTIIFLESLGLLKRVFRTIIINGLKCSNVLFIELIPSQIKLFSDEKNNIQEYSEDNSMSDVSHSDVEGCPEIMGDLPTSKCETNTTNSQSISQLNSKSHCCGETATKRKSKKSEPTFSNNDYSRVFSIYYANCQILHENGRLDADIPVQPVLPAYVKKLVKLAFVNYGVENVVNAVKESKNHDWLVDDMKYNFTTIFGQNELPMLINKTYSNSKTKSSGLNKNTEHVDLSDKISLGELAFCDDEHYENDYDMSKLAVKTEDEIDF